MFLIIIEHGKKKTCVKSDYRIHKFISLFILHSLFVHAPFKILKECRAISICYGQIEEERHGAMHNTIFTNFSRQKLVWRVRKDTIHPHPEETDIVLLCRCYT